ncbi:hypothetical protein HPB48_002633 [Haemaphysalis longicornis]|uniref:Uncharacterized protein n=1 Tax=Haemaphysalis longicornis TaxID=44386 RepID=A0A9J6G179_HAELO|nr:hypothetical protein HPB48_002633 [Haemaphysalis longicornis]
MVEGEEISREEVNSPGWKASLGRNKNARIGTPVSAGNASHVGWNGRRRTAAPQGAMKRLAAASRLPRLPRDHRRIIVGPRPRYVETEGDIVCPRVAQNILVISTPATKNANACAGIQQIRTSEGSYNLAAYISAPDNTCKAVIPGVDVDISDAQLQTMIVNQRNPKALEAKRIKKTTTVVVLFEGMKVLNYVSVRRLTSSPTPTRRIASPPEDHQCSPKCALCGGPHPMADRMSQGRFQVPYVVRRRRRRRNHAKKTQQQLAQEGRSRDSSVASATRRERSVTPAGRRRGHSRGRSHSRVRIQEESTWADRVKLKQAAQPPKAVAHLASHAASARRRGSLATAAFACRGDAEEGEEDRMGASTGSGAVHSEGAPPVEKAPGRLSRRSSSAVCTVPTSPILR